MYFTRAELSKAPVRPLCDAIATQSLKSIDAAADLRGLYGGAGGTVLEGAELYRFASHMSPPSYDELAPSPPKASKALLSFYLIFLMTDFKLITTQ